jgi:hypothetical protein
MKLSADEKQKKFYNIFFQEEEIGIVEEDLEMFYTKWAKYEILKTS